MKENNEKVKKKILLNDFENKIVESFSSAQLDFDNFFSKESTIMFGVSGGADSVALLFAFTEIRKKISSNNFPRFFVVTIDHNIRPAEESSGDALFVQKLCQKLNVECNIVQFPKGLVFNTASERMKGIEEAARFLRYQVFEQIAKEQKADLFCLAHNRNDQLETLLMRFLQGSDNSSGSGIPVCRGIFFRPILDISRKEIEEYLLQNKISYRTDSTNADESYFRNKIRNTLIPVIEQSFPGWDKAVLSGAEKKQEDNIALESLIKNQNWTKDINKNGNPFIYTDVKSYYEMQPALRRRFIYNGLNILAVSNRVPYKTVKKVVYAVKDSLENIPSFSFFSVNLNFFSDGKNLFIEDVKNKKEDFVKGFYSVIDKAGIYHFPFGKLCVTEIDSFECTKKQQKNVFLSPVVVRSPLASDFVVYNGKKENLMDYLSSLGIQREIRQSVPVLESCNGESVSLIPGFFNKNMSSDSFNFCYIKDVKEKKCLIIEMITEV